MKLRCEENNKTKFKSVKDKDTKWWELKEMLNKEKDCKKNNNKEWKYSSVDLCYKNLQERINYNNWPNKRKEWNNNNIKDKLKDYGSKDLLHIDYKSKDNNSNI